MMTERLRSSRSLFLTGAKQPPGRRHYLPAAVFTRNYLFARNRISVERISVFGQLNLIFVVQFVNFRIVRSSNVNFS